MTAKARKAWELANLILDCNDDAMNDSLPGCTACANRLRFGFFGDLWWHPEFASLALDGIDISELP